MLGARTSRPQRADRREALSYDWINSRFALTADEASAFPAK